MIEDLAADRVIGAYGPLEPELEVGIAVPLAVERLLPEPHGLLDLQHRDEHVVGVDGLARQRELEGRAGFFPDLEGLGAVLLALQRLRGIGEVPILGPGGGSEDDQHPKRQRTKHRGRF